MSSHHHKESVPLAIILFVLFGRHRYGQVSIVPRDFDGAIHTAPAQQSSFSQAFAFDAVRGNLLAIWVRCLR